MFMNAVIPRTIVDMSDSRYVELTQLGLIHDKRSSASEPNNKKRKLGEMFE